MECRKELSGVKRREQIIDNLREHYLISLVFQK